MLFLYKRFYTSFSKSVWQLRLQKLALGKRLILSCLEKSSPINSFFCNKLFTISSLNFLLRPKWLLKFYQKRGKWQWTKKFTKIINWTFIQQQNEILNLTRFLCCFVRKNRKNSIINFFSFGFGDFSIPKWKNENFTVFTSNTAQSFY